MSPAPAGLTADQLTLRSAAPSSLSLQGLVRHLAGVERWWFRRNFAGLEIEEYARHNRHADLLRERIDGVTGR